jgi:hypothetical protein
VIEKQQTKFEDCDHPEEYIIEGPRHPLRYGSAATQLCTKCGGFRLNFHYLHNWEPGPVPSKDDFEEEI